MTSTSGQGKIAEPAVSPARPLNGGKVRNFIEIPLENAIRAIPACWRRRPGDNAACWYFNLLLSLVVESISHGRFPKVWFHPITGEPGGELVLSHVHYRRT